MTTITDINELNKILRQYVIQQSEVDSNFVRNSLSTYGENLNKLLFRQEYNSICPCDTLILFELVNRNSTNNVSMTEDDNSVTSYMSYTFKLIIYGTSANNVANKLIARMRTESIREKLLSEGVYLEHIDDAMSVNEFINGIMIQRQDVDIQISCQLSTIQISNDNIITSIDQPKILNKETT